MIFAICSISPAFGDRDDECILVVMWELLLVPACIVECKELEAELRATVPNTSGGIPSSPGASLFSCLDSFVELISTYWQTRFFLHG